MYGMDYLPEVAQAGNTDGFQTGLDRHVTGRAIREPCRQLRSAPRGCEFRWPSSSLLCAHVGSLWTRVLALDLNQGAVSTLLPTHTRLCGFGLTEAAKPCCFYLCQVFSADAVFLFWSHMCSVLAGYSRSIMFSSLIIAILRKYFLCHPTSLTALLKCIALSILTLDF